MMLVPYSKLLLNLTGRGRVTARGRIGDRVASDRETGEGRESRGRLVSRSGTHGPPVLRGALGSGSVGQPCTLEVASAC